MKPAKARRRIVEAFNIDPDVMIVLTATERIVRGTMTDVQVNTAPVGASGEMVAGLTSIVLTIEVRS